MKKTAIISLLLLIMLIGMTGWVRCAETNSTIRSKEVTASSSTYIETAFFSLSIPSSLVSSYSFTQQLMTSSDKDGKVIKWTLSSGLPSTVDCGEAFTADIAIYAFTGPCELDYDSKYQSVEYEYFDIPRTTGRGAIDGIAIVYPSEVGGFIRASADNHSKLVLLPDEVEVEDAEFIVSSFRLR